MRTEFEELDVVPVEQEKEVEGYYGKKAVIIWSLVVVISLLGILRWHVL
jgi:hypothetical protein